MRLILHVGMGKTGTSAIQGALRQNPEALAAAGARYLGMRLDFLDPPAEVKKNQAFLREDKASKVDYAGRLSAHLAGLAAEGVTCAILSNEGLWGQAEVLRPFLDALDPAIKVTVIGYVRNPDRWLPSAYAQWGLADKVNRGGIKPYAEVAGAFATRYRSALEWREMLGAGFALRHYDAAGDVVGDFLAAIGVQAALSGARANPRRNRGELALRALFNNRFPGHAVPGLFDGAVMPPDAPILGIADLARDCFDYGPTAGVVAQNAALWDEIRTRFGIDLTAAQASPEVVSPETLGELVLTLAERVAALEGPKALRKVRGRAAEEGLSRGQRQAVAALQEAQDPLAAARVRKGLKGPKGRRPRED